MTFKHKLLTGSLAIVAVLALAGGYYSRHRFQPRLNQPAGRQVAVKKRRRVKLNPVNAVHYSVRPVSWRTQQVTQATSLWSAPRSRASVQRGSTRRLMNSLVNQSNLVQPLQLAWNKRTQYVLISRQGKKLGWINRRDLRSTQTYMLPYVYTSQFWPSKADDACELASLKTALSTQSKAMHVSLRRMVQRVPRTSDPNRGYTNDPYEYGSHATIYPDAMVKIARRYGAHAKNITGASSSRMIYEVTHGHAVVFEGPYMMKKPGSDHDLTILGYKPGYFYVADPFARHHYSPRSTWVSVPRMMRIFNKPFRHQRALTIY